LLTLPSPFPGGVTGLPDLTYETLSGYRPMKLTISGRFASKA
jgi:hypothetical protein